MPSRLELALARHGALAWPQPRGDVLWTWVFENLLELDGHLAGLGLSLVGGVRDIGPPDLEELATLRSELTELTPGTEDIDAYRSVEQYLAALTELAEAVVEEQSRRHGRRPLSDKRLGPAT